MASISEGVDDDDQSVTSAALGIESSATSFTAPRHVLLELDDEEDLRSIDCDGDVLTTTSSRFWGVSWDRKDKKWKAYYIDANGKKRHVGLYVDEEEAARARDQAVRDAGLEGKRRMNAVDATGALVPRERTHTRDRSTVVAPDPSRALSTTTSKFWGVTWDRKAQRWRAKYTDANGKRCNIGYFDTQEAAAHAVNAAIRRAGLEGKRRTNPVVDGRLVPKPPGPHNKKRRREEAAAAPSARARRR